MARILVTTLADSVDARPGSKFHIAGGGLDGLTVAGLPSLFGRLSVAIALALAEGERKIPLSTDVIDPSGKSLVHVEAQIERESSNPDEIWFGIAFPPIQMISAGPYRVVTRSGESEHTRTLNVRVEPGPGIRVPMPVPGQVH
jgi:hypothetical protein